MPRVSVVIPAFNAAATIARAVDSVLCQTAGDLEVVVCDDGSTDGTPEVLDGYRDRVVVVTQPNRGRGAARNRAIERVTGELVAFLDADDWWVHDKLALQLAAAGAHPRRDVFYGNAFVVDGGGRIYRSMNGEWHVGHSGHVFPYLLRNNFVPLLTVLVRRAALDRAGPFDESIVRCQDLDLLLRLAARSEFHYSNVMLGYCDDRNWSSADKRVETYTGFLKVLDKTAQAFPDLAARHAHHLAKSRSDCHSELGRWHEERHELAEAAAEYELALAWTPRSRALRWKLALALYGARALDRCRRVLDEWVADDPYHVEARYYLGNIHLAGGALDQARREYELALYGGYLYQRFPECVNNLGVVCARQGEADRAIELFEQAAAQQSFYSDALLNLQIIGRSDAPEMLRWTARKVF